MNLEDIMSSSNRAGQKDKQHKSDANVEFKKLISQSEGGQQRTKKTRSQAAEQVQSPSRMQGVSSGVTLNVVLLWLARMDGIFQNRRKRRF